MFWKCRRHLWILRPADYKAATAQEFQGDNRTLRKGGAPDQNKMVEACFLYIGSQGILWSADHNKSIYARNCIDITLFYSCWLPDLEGYSAPSRPLVDRSGVCGQLTTTGSSTWSSQLGATRPR
jgi:hypothetical protein